MAVKQLALASKAASLPEPKQQFNNQQFSN
jgi:hypothetical protein